VSRALAGSLTRDSEERPMIAESAAHGGSDPLKTVADAMDDAVKAIKDGAGEVAASVNDAIPAARGLFARLAYTTTYSISYGLVFPAVLVVRAIPKENALVHGLIDGARAATDAVETWHTKPQVESSTPATPLEQAV
jgi:hypothetical protein